ncbi:uncharacterized protein LOC131249019 isoform X2 [Magnolia sinica]|uniref:uncharacterized protein LOC131249019 isoform X2 n=1 Tax=Magnolia sinica TaxID=86752 RepID=UPI002658B890|nr:uncharacterized protein LOC131249019 isoform X2 [Magnolia sinica]
MLSGVKFIPPDQLHEAEQNSDSNYSAKERKKSISRKEKDRGKKKKDQYDSSGDEEIVKIKKGSKRRKKWYSSDASSSSSLSQTDNESDADSGGEAYQKHKTSAREKNRKKEKRTQHQTSNDEVRERSKKKSKSRKECYSSDDSSEFDSESDDNRHSSRKEEQQKRGRKHKKEKSKERRGQKVVDKNDLSDDGRDLVPQDNKGRARKEMGLEWMLKPATQPSMASTQIDDPLEEPHVDEVQKPNPRELNPYLKDNGIGYPDEDSQTKADMNRLPPSSVVGDGGASWRLKALKRAQEQAAREGRKLDEVVGERWGSLGNLAVSAASRSAAHAHAHLHAIRDRKRGPIEKQGVADDQNEKATEKVGNSRRYSRDVSLRHPEMREPKVRDSLSWGKRKVPKMSAEDAQLISSAASHLNKYANDGSFLHEFDRFENKDASGSGNSTHADIEGNENLDSGLVSLKTGNENEDSGLVSLKNDNSTQGRSVSKQVMSTNQLAAKVLQLRMKGKHEEAEKLLKETETTAGEQETKAKTVYHGTEGSISRYAGRNISSRQKKGDDDADMHLARTIVQNKQYSMSGRADDEYDFDGAPSKKRNRKREGTPEKNTIAKRLMTQQERCQFCFENPTRPKHLVVSIANFTYLMLPQWQPVVQGHCCILPMQHESATRTVDNDVWDEIRNFKKCLLMMFAKQDKDVVFLETVMGLAKQRRHCLVECIPLPRDIAKEAPLYFKKDIHAVRPN